MLKVLRNAYAKYAIIYFAGGIICGFMIGLVCSFIYWLFCIPK